MTQLARRSFITGLVALVAAPAIVRAGSLMAVNSGLVPGNTLLTIDQITREAVRLFQHCNQELAAIDVLYGSMTLKPGDVRSYVNWEADYAFMAGEQWDKDRSTGLLRYNKQRRSIDVVPKIPDSLALAAAAVAIAPVVLAKSVTRRFWGK